MWRALVLCLVLGIGSAQAVEEGDRAAIRGVIERQIQAFKATMLRQPMRWPRPKSSACSRSSAS
jgi:hypothetical protein